MMLCNGSYDEWVELCVFAVLAVFMCLCVCVLVCFFLPPLELTHYFHECLSLHLFGVTNARSSKIANVRFFQIPPENDQMDRSKVECCEVLEVSNKYESRVTHSTCVL